MAVKHKLSEPFIFTTTFATYTATHIIGEGKKYRSVTALETEVFHRAKEALAHLQAEYRGALSLVPNEPLPPDGTLGFRIQKYGFLQWGQLSSPARLWRLTGTR